MNSFRKYSDRHGKAAAVTALVVMGPSGAVVLIGAVALVGLVVVTMVPAAVLAALASLAERGIRRALGLEALGTHGDDDRPPEIDDNP